MLRAIIVDDDAAVRQRMEALLVQHCPSVALVGTAPDVPHGVRLVEAEKPDLILLDVEMPGHTGFELIDFFPEPTFDVVFATGHPDYALRAFQASAVDYLLKPVQGAQLAQAVDKVLRMRGKARTGERLSVLREGLSSPEPPARIVLPTSSGYLFIRPDEILCLEADGAYSEVFLVSGEKLVISRNLREFEQVLVHPQFFRPHRSHIINLRHVARFNKADGGAIVMANGREIPLSPIRKDVFLEAIVKF